MNRQSIGNNKNMLTLCEAPFFHGKRWQISFFFQKTNSKLENDLYELSNMITVSDNFIQDQENEIKAKLVSTFVMLLISFYCGGVFQ